MICKIAIAGFLATAFLTGCGNYKQAIESGKKQEPIASVYARFPDAESSIQHYLAKDKSTKWTTRVPIRQRYVLVVEAAIVFGSRSQIDGFGNTRAHILEISDVAMGAQGQGPTEIRYGYQWNLSEDQLKQLLKDGDFGRIGVHLDKGPIEHFDQAWRSS